MDTIELWFSDSSTESDEEAWRNLHQQRRRIRDAFNPLEMDTKLFLSNFRLTKEAFLHVLNKINSRIPPGLRQTRIPNILKLAVTLQFFAQGSYQLSVGNEGFFGISQGTVSCILSEIVEVMESILCPEYINFQYTEAEEDVAKLFFYNNCKIPGIVGAIDGTHVKIVAPAKRVQHLYYNRKGFYSINAMIVCDHNMIIRFINAKYPGSSHDSMVFNNSSLKLLLENRYQNGVRNTWLLGDAGYALQPYLMTPYRSPDEGSIESKYNTQHAKGRNIVERTIGVYKNRWRCVLGARALHYTPEKATQIINVCAALHNICRKFNVPFDEVLQDINDQHNEDGNNRVPNVERNEAEAIRSEIARSIQI